MRHLCAERFLQVDEAELAAYADARAAEVGLVVAESFLSSVLENLSSLQAHARRVSAALQGLDDASSGAAEASSNDDVGLPRAPRI